MATRAFIWARPALIEATDELLVRVHSATLGWLARYVSFLLIFGGADDSSSACGRLETLGLELQAPLNVILNFQVYE